MTLWHIEYSKLIEWRIYNLMLVEKLQYFLLVSVVTNNYQWPVLSIIFFRTFRYIKVIEKFHIFT